MTLIDAGSPVPLYHQIANALRERIRSGELSAGDVLEPLREAAETWGVNLHTVRHAYAALARDGFVETLGTRGTRVTTLADRPPEESRADFVGRVIREGRERGLEPHDLADAISDACEVGIAPVVYFAECSAWQSEAHAREITERFQVEAHPWSLECGDQPPGTVLSTFFHYNDVRRRWPHLLRQVTFLAITPDRSLVDTIASMGAVERLVVCEWDRETAEAVAGDISTLLPDDQYMVEVVVSDTPRQVVEHAGEGTVVIFAPRVWATLDPKTRSHPQAIEAKYVIESAELERVARTLGWTAQRRSA